MLYIFYDLTYKGNNKWGITDLEKVTFNNTFISAYNNWLTDNKDSYEFGDNEKTINGFFKQLKDEVYPEDSNPELIATVKNIIELPKLHPELFI